MRDRAESSRKEKLACFVPRAKAGRGCPEGIFVFWIEEEKGRSGREPGSLENFGQVIDECAREQLGDFCDFRLAGVEEMDGQPGEWT